MFGDLLGIGRVGKVQIGLDVQNLNLVDTLHPVQSIDQNSPIGRAIRRMPDVTVIEQKRDLDVDTRVGFLKKSLRPKYFDDGSARGPVRDEAWSLIVEDFSSDVMLGKASVGGIRSYANSLPSGSDIAAQTIGDAALSLIGLSGVPHTGCLNTGILKEFHLERYLWRWSVPRRVAHSLSGVDLEVFSLPPPMDVSGDIDGIRAARGLAHFPKHQLAIR
jgi:hypothetical protein